VNPLTALVGSCLLTWGITPREDIAVETVDLIEVNHFYDDQGRLVFDQCIFYDWSPADGRFMVRAWRLVKNPSQLPQRDWAAGGYTAVWQDGDVLRKVVSEGMRESWTQHDPELVEREYLPKERRRDLTPAATIRTANR
jgi:hypothetical protein